MQLKLGFWKKSIFARLLTTFLVVIIPIYIIGIAIYNWGISSVKDEVINSMSYQMSTYITNLEKDIQRIKVLQSDSLLSDDLNRLANSQQFMNDYEKSDYMLRLQQRLDAVKSSSLFIKNVIAVVPSIKKTIAAAGGISDLGGEDLDMMKKYDNTTHAQIIYSQNDLLMNSGFPLNYIPGKATPLYSITIRFSIEELQTRLRQFDYNKETGSVMFDRSGKFSIYTGTDMKLVQYIQEKVKAQPETKDEGKIWLNYDNKSYLVIYKTSRYLGLTLCSHIPQSHIFSTLSRYKIWIWLFSVVSGMIVLIYSLTSYRFIQKPLQKLIKAFKRLESGDMSFSIKHNYNDEFEYLYEHFNSMLQSLNTLIDQSYKQKIMVQRAELKQLQAQINPHFLYNSFFILYTMTRKGQYETLENFALQLGEYFQFLTRSASDEVTLELEANHARTYCEIQALRFSNRIKIEFDELPEEFRDLEVPRLIIQPIVENAFEHGLERKESDGLLRVQFVKENAKLHIIVEDNGEYVSQSALETMRSKLHNNGNEIETTGTVNIHRRIQLKFGSESGISVSIGELGGLRISIDISLQEEEEHVQTIDR